MPSIYRRQKGRRAGNKKDGRSKEGRKYLKVAMFWAPTVCLAPNEILYTYYETPLYLISASTQSMRKVSLMLQIRNWGSEDLSNSPKVKALINKDSIQNLKTGKPVTFLMAWIKMAATYQELSSCQILGRPFINSVTWAHWKDSRTPGTPPTQEAAVKVATPFSTQTRTALSNKHRGMVLCVAAHLPTIHPSPWANELEEA